MVISQEVIIRRVIIVIVVYSRYSEFGDIFKLYLVEYTP